MTHNHKICIKIDVSGKVQGVNFRDYAKQKAQELNLTGWVRNHEKGHVELVACGMQDRIMEFTNWLWQGSPNSEVSNVHWEEIELEDHSNFSVNK